MLSIESLIPVRFSFIQVERSKHKCFQHCLIIESFVISHTYELIKTKIQLDYSNNKREGDTKKTHTIPRILFLYLNRISRNDVPTSRFFFFRKN